MNSTHQSINKIYKGGRGGDVKLDLHTWVECEGKCIDYDDDDLKNCSLYGTDKIVRVPFDNKLSGECLPLIMEVVDAKMEIAIKMDLVGECFELWSSQTGNCCCRSVILYSILKKQGRNPKLKIGSLGFIQPNHKDIFYEYG